MAQARTHGGKHRPPSRWKRTGLCSSTRTARGRRRGVQLPPKPPPVRLRLSLMARCRMHARSPHRRQRPPRLHSHRAPQGRTERLQESMLYVPVRPTCFAALLMATFSVFMGQCRFPGVFLQHDGVVVWYGPNLKLNSTAWYGQVYGGLLAAETSRSSFG